MDRRFQINKKHVDFTRICAALSNTTRIAILEKIASMNACITGDFIEMGEVSKFTVGQNIKQLSKFNLIKGTFTKKSTVYCINYEQLEEWKLSVDEIYSSLMKNKQNVNPENTACSVLSNKEESK